MVRPQSENLNRSGNTPLDPDSIGGKLDARDRPEADDRTGGPVPPENRPGHHPVHEQDQPDPDAFVARFGGHDDEGDGGPAGARVALSRATETAKAIGSSAWRVARTTADAIRREVDDFRTGRAADETGRAAEEETSADAH
jgi:hypothetical protein